MTDLLPCPFCGASPPTTVEDREQGNKWGFAFCPECAARGPEVRTRYDLAPDAPWRADAIAAWNRRADPDARGGSGGGFTAASGGSSGAMP